MSHLNVDNRFQYHEIVCQSKAKYIYIIHNTKANSYTYSFTITAEEICEDAFPISFSGSTDISIFATQILCFFFCFTIETLK